MLNNAGQTAFLGTVAGTDVVDSNAKGIFATDKAGHLHKVAREGDLFDVNQDPLVIDNRTIKFVNFNLGSSGSGGRSNSFNNAGQLTFALTFTDGTRGLFVATIALPEPASLTLMGIGCLTLLVRRRK